MEVVRHRLGELLARLWPTVRPHRWVLLFGCSLIAIAGGLFGIMPLFLKQLLDQALPQQNLTLALYITGGFLLCHLVRMALWNFAMLYILLTQEKVTFALRAQGFGHLQRLSLRFHNKYPSGFLYQSIFGSAINTVAGCMQTILKQLSLYITAILTSFISCLLLSPSMTAVVLGGSCLYVALARFSSPRIYQRSKETQEAQMRITDFIVDRLRGTKTIQALALEDRVQQDFETRLWPAQLTALRATRQTQLFSQTTEYVGYLVTAAIMLVGAWQHQRGQLSVGELVAFMGYQATFITIVQVLTNVWGEISSARAGMDRLYTVLSTASNVPDEPTCAIPVGPRSTLEFRRVSFAYEPGQPVFRELNLTVPGGQTIALVGASGGGKTSVANLLLRFYDPDQGQILIDGVDIRTLPLREYRSLFGVVLQDPYLFNESIANNLRYANPDATDIDLIRALQHARAWKFVEQFPDGINHRVGESGGSLSGGQRQRLAIARCLLLRSRFVILDEPTSALDVESEHLIQEAFDKLFEGRTVFVIAHRLSTIRKANRILVVQDGGIAEEGTFSELLARNGQFKRMYDLATQVGQETPDSQRLY